MYGRGKAPSELTVGQTAESTSASSTTVRPVELLSAHPVERVGSTSTAKVVALLLAPIPARSLVVVFLPAVPVALRSVLVTVLVLLTVILVLILVVTVVAG
jgi:hypothetical protein